VSARSGAGAALRTVAPVLGLAAFLATWEAFVRLRDVRRFVLLPPSAIVRYLARAPGDFAAASWITARHAAVGFGAALVVAIALGAAMAAWPLFERAAQPVLVLVQVTPFVAYVSSVVLWLGAGDPPVHFTVALVCTPIFAFAAAAGMRGADLAAREVLASVDAPRWEVLWRLRLPAALPSLVTAARINVALSLVVAYLLEGANLRDDGLGAIGKRAVNFDADALWAAVLCMALLGVAGLVLVGAFERFALHWHASQRTLRRGARS